MAGEPVFQLFPPNSQRIEPPARKGSLRFPTNTATEQKSTGLDSRTGGQDVLIGIAETTPEPASISPPAEAHTVQKQRSATPSGKSPLRVRVPSPIQASYSPRSHTSSPTLVRNGSIGSTGKHSPVMRSMFPRFNPSISLAQQRYHPPREGAPRTQHLPKEVVNRSEYSPSLYSQRGATSPKFGNNVGPLAIQREEPAPKYSTASELLSLWNMANGQEIQADGPSNTFTLQLDCTDHLGRECIFLAPPNSPPFYTLQANGSDFTIFRSHPINPTPTITINTPTLYSPSTTQPLLASFFPKLAELMALDQSSTVAIAYKLSRSASSDLQTEALSRARLREAASLYWDSDSQRYYFIHPTLDNGTNMTFPITITHPPTSSHPTSLSILAPITDPNSTEPQPILTFSITTRVLTIHTAPLAPLPSLYILDTLLSTLLTLLLHLHRTTSLLSSPTAAPSYAFTFDPPPKLAPAPSSSSRKQRTKSRLSLNPFRAARGTLNTASTTHLTSPTPTSSPLPYTNKEALALAAEDSNVSSDSPPWALPPTFRPVNVDDPGLPAGTRAVLKLLYWVFGALVWGMGVFVGLVAAAVVGLGGVVKRL